MSNLPPNPYNNMPGPAQVNANPGAQFNHNQQYGQVPSNQLPPRFGEHKQDPNSNSPQHGSVSAHNNIQNMNNYNQSVNSSPAFNQPGMMPLPPTSLQSSPMRPPPSSASGINPMGQVPLSSGSPRPSTTNPNPPYQPQHQINDNAPPLISSSQFNQPLMNGPPLPIPSTTMPPNNFPISSAYTFSPADKSTVSAAGYVPGPIPPFGGPRPALMPNQPSVPFSSTPHGPTRNSPLIPGFPGSGSQSFSGPPAGSLGPPKSADMINGPYPSSQMPSGQTGPPAGPATGVMNASTMGPPGGPSKTYSGQLNNGPIGPGPLRKFIGPIGPQMQPMGPQNFLAMGAQSLPPMGNQMAPPFSRPPGPIGQPDSSGLQVGPPKTGMQSRYPQMPQSSYAHQQPTQMQQQPNIKQYPQQYNANINQQMGQLSVTNQGFDRLWGHEIVDLLNCKHILPQYPEDPPEIKLGHQFADSSNCSSDIFRCTVNRIPETNSLLQKSRLPLGILIHPFKDLNHLPVIQCTSIVRCRSCRTYINPFVYFVDAKRWKCNLCYRVNDLPEEFQYDPVSKSYGDPSRRPEIKSATIEFIAPGEYMLRPPQPAVYLFLFDVSQLARDSGYLQVVCDTLKANLEQLPGDARTQIGFICYDAHVHYYLMSEGLTRPKEMTVIDIDEVFLPSPSSLLVNMGERLELVREVLTVLPQRHAAAAPRGASACALGAALNAAYKLMAPTGGRITVFQTCLPNIGPGALQPREDPNARSCKDVAHLNPATDFYKRIALDCSGAQIAVDLFLLNSQYSDLATLSGMSKFSAGTVYHMPLFRADRDWQAEQLTKIFTRYLTRKIGFEAVMRVRCTRGIAIHTFHGNFFVRSTDLLSLPNVSPDAGFGMQLTIEESLADLQQVCFQAALLYTSSKGERRIRVHTLALPTASTLPDVLHSADQFCIIGLLSKMAVDRCVTASMSEAREALMNVAVDALSAHRLARNQPLAAADLSAPRALRLLPLYLHALLKRKAFRTGTSTRLDDRVADMCDLKCQPLAQVLRGVYPDLYPVHALHDHEREPGAEDDDEAAPDPPRLQLSAESISRKGAYLLDDGATMILYVCCEANGAFLSDTLAVDTAAQLPAEARALPRLPTRASRLLHALLDKLNDDRPHPAELLILRDNSPSRQLFTERLVDDRVESSLSYYEFLQHVKTQLK